MLNTDGLAVLRGTLQDITGLGFVVDQEVSSQQWDAWSEAPEVQIHHVLHAIQHAKLFCDSLDRVPSRHALHENVGDAAKDGYGGAQHEESKKERANGVRNVPSLVIFVPPNQDPRKHNTNALHQISNNMNASSSDAHVLMVMPVMIATVPMRMVVFVIIVVLMFMIVGIFVIMTMVMPMSSMPMPMTEDKYHYQIHHKPRNSYYKHQSPIDVLWVPDPLNGFKDQHTSDLPNYED